MKIYNAASLSALAIFLSGNAFANTGTIKFSGAVTSSTCDINVSVNGVVSPTGVAELGTYAVADASAIGKFGAPINIALVPDLSSCNVAPGGSNAQINISATSVDSANTDVITDGQSSITKVGVHFTLESGTSVVNKGNVALASGSTDLDATTAKVNFVAQPYATTTPINAGNIGGVVAYTISYL
jgi:major type 1 subunit fimbrin (pilin)